MPLGEPFTLELQAVKQTPRDEACVCTPLPAPLPSLPALHVDVSAGGAPAARGGRLGGSVPLKSSFIQPK